LAWCGDLVRHRATDSAPCRGRRGVWLASGWRAAWKAGAATS